MIPKAHLVPNSINRYAFTSQEIVRRGDGSFQIVVAPRASAGQLVADRRRRALRRSRCGFYDTAVGVCDQGRPRNADARGQDQELPMIRWLLLLFGGALLGGIVHLGTIIILPRTATQDAYSRLARSRRSIRWRRCLSRRPRRPLMPLHGSGFCQRRLPLRPFGKGR